MLILMTRSSMVEHSTVNRGVVGSSPTESVMALQYKGDYTRLSIGRFGFDSQQSRLWDVGQMAKLQPFHGCDASSILARPTLCGKPDVKAYFLDAYETQACKLNTYYRPIKLSVGNNYADYSDKVVMKIVSFSLEKDNFLKKESFHEKWLFYYIRLQFNWLEYQTPNLRDVGSTPTGRVCVN